MHAPVHCFQNVLTYFAAAVSYTHKMFVKFTPVVIFIHAASFVVSKQVK